MNALKERRKDTKKKGIRARIKLREDRKKNEECKERKKQKGRYEEAGNEGQKRNNEQMF